MKVGFYNLGCKVNTYETEFMKSLFIEHNYIIEDKVELCDIYVINTCTVTNTADDKSKKIISSIRKKNEKACIIVCGCYAESHKDFEFKNIDIVIGNSNKSNIINYVNAFMKNRKQIIAIDNIMNCPFENMEIKHFESHTRAFVKIQDGCQNYCSYCIIPFVRGKCRSKKEEDVISEITTLVNNNYKEIVLTGIHTGNYGEDINTNLSNLIEKLLLIPNLQRLRISSIEITEIDDKFIKLLKNKKLCNHLHIPLQSGSDKILKLMNRKYNTKDFEKIINKIRKVRDDISLTTDVIVGFPNETENDYSDCLNFIKKIGFNKIHVFPYSKRYGTKAYNMPNQIDNIEKKKRVTKLINLSRELEKKYYNNYIDKELEILIEKYDGIYSYGHTSNYLYLKIEDKLNINEIYSIKFIKTMIED